MSESPRNDADEPDADDDLGLDESMSSMRAMFREMRDEEPSDKGMVALLAAAREKAEEMKPKRSWWTALLEQLRRPPVLAMATVVVLIGGAVVISQRDEMKDSTEPVSTERAAAEAMPSRSSPDIVGDRFEDKLGKQKEGEAGDGEGIEEAKPAEPTATGSPAPGSPAAPRPRPPTKSTRVREPTAKPDAVEKVPPPVAFDVAAESPRDTQVDQGKAPMTIATDDDLAPKGGATESTSAPQADHKSVSRKPLPSIEGEDRTSKDTSIAQLVKQCEAAAAKNDCAAVRAIAAKIAQQDPQTYRTRVLKSASVARCLDPPAVIDAAPNP